MTDWQKAFEDWWHNTDGIYSYAKSYYECEHAFRIGYEATYAERFSMSAQISYLERLIKEYETVIPEDKQKQIKDFIFSEDDK